MNSLIKRIFFRNTEIKTFFITRLQDHQVEEGVFLKKGSNSTDISRNHAMICLDPFCVAVWLSAIDAALFDRQSASMQFKRNGKLNASIDVSLTEKIPTSTGALLLYKVGRVENKQLTAIHRLALFGHLLRSKTNTYYSRRVISALYSYPRSIIIVSYRDDCYCNVFPMDIHGYIQQDDIYLLGLRTTNITLDKILQAKRVVVCDTDTVDIQTVYDLGKHSSKSPAAREDLPFGTSESELFGFPVPDFTASYKEIEIIQHKKMGYHMLMIGRVIHIREIRKNASSLYHLGFLQFQDSSYSKIDGLF